MRTVTNATTFVEKEKQRLCWATFHTGSREQDGSKSLNQMANSLSTLFLSVSDVNLVKTRFHMFFCVFAWTRHYAILKHFFFQNSLDSFGKMNQAKTTSIGEFGERKHHSFNNVENQNLFVAITKTFLTLLASKYVWSPLQTSRYFKSTESNKNLYFWS